MQGLPRIASIARSLLTAVLAAALSLAGAPPSAVARPPVRMALSPRLPAPLTPRGHGARHRRADWDHDGLSNWTEVHRTHTNPRKADTDGDGLSDWVEVKRTHTNPRKADTDGDGLSDWVEVRITRTNPRRADSDGDGFSDGEEVAAGSNPWDPASVPAARQSSPSPMPEPRLLPALAPPPAAAQPTKAIWTAPAEARVGVPVTLDGTGSTGEPPLTCTWSFENQSGSLVFQERAGCKVDFTFESTGTKYVRLTVQSANGGDSSKQSLDVVPAPESETPETEPETPDTTPPDTSITSGPQSTTTSTSASFSFSSTEPGSSFECSLDGSPFSSCSSPKSYAELSAGGHTFSVRAIDVAGNVDPTPATATWMVSEPVPPAPGSHCFSSPHTCGYPDPTNTGIPAGTELTPHGDLTVSTAGTTVDGLDVTGWINVTADNVTIQNTRVTLNDGGCGTTNTCGNYDIRINEGVSGTLIKNVETLAASGTTCEHDIRNTSSAEVKIVSTFMHACDSNLYTAGKATMTDSYGIAKLAISTDHVENVYFNDTSFTATHDTLLNPIDQTAVIFGNVGGGSGGACENHLTVTDSLLAGGGFTLYPCGNASSAGSSTTVVEGNHFARCTGSEVSTGGGSWGCSGGPDSNGYYPRSGGYGIASYYFGGTWQGNVWDDDLSSVPRP